jgi:hypothetical protein
MHTKLSLYASYILSNYNIIITYHRFFLVAVTSSLTLRKVGRLRVFESRVSGRMSWPERDEVTGEWRKLHDEKLNDLYPSPIIVRVIKSRRMRWAGYVARIGNGMGEACTGFWWGNLRESDHWGDPGLDGKIILRWIFRKWYVVV